MAVTAQTAGAACTVSSRMVRAWHATWACAHGHVPHAHQHTYITFSSYDPLPEP